MQTDEDKIEAMKFAMKLIGLRLRSEQELLDRLRRKGYAESLSLEVMAEMERYGYINDSRFAESYINDRINFRPAGHYVIKMELKAKGISEDIVDAKLDELLGRDVELRLAEKLAKKKIRIAGVADRRQVRNRVIGYLGSKGFSSDIISQAVDNAIKLDQDID